MTNVFAMQRIPRSARVMPHVSAGAITKDEFPFTTFNRTPLHFILSIYHIPSSLPSRPLACQVRSSTLIYTYSILMMITMLCVCTTFCALRELSRGRAAASLAECLGHFFGQFAVERLSPLCFCFPITSPLRPLSIRPAPLGVRAAVWFTPYWFSPPTGSQSVSLQALPSLSFITPSITVFCVGGNLLKKPMLVVGFILFQGERTIVWVNRAQGTPNPFRS